jgi:hypothetical protein
MAIVLGHALAPVGSPLVRASGSAFSAATADVSLGPARPLLANAKPSQAADDETGPTFDHPPVLVAASYTALPRSPESAPTFAPATEPARPSPRSQGFDARAPPARA